MNINSLVIGSGGVKIFLLLGAIDYLFEKNILNNVKYLAGSSSGSIICLLLSIGYTPKEICAYMCSNDVISYLHNINPILLIKEFGLIDLNQMKTYLDEMCVKKIGYIPTFNDLYNNFDKFFICSALNLNGKDKHESFKYFSHLTDGDMEVTKAVCLSSSIPIVFTNSIYNNTYYVDGGIFDRAPVDKLIELTKSSPNNLICVDFDNTEFNVSPINNFLDYVLKISNIPFIMQSSIISNKDFYLINLKTDLNIIEFDLDTKKKIKLFEEGKKQCKICFSLLKNKSNQSTGKVQDTETENIKFDQFGNEKHKND